MLGKLLSALYAARRYDQRRSGVPGEHFAAASVGTALLGFGSRTRSPALKVAALLAGGALMWRAVSGRDGIARFRR